MPSIKCLFISEFFFYSGKGTRDWTKEWMVKQQNVKKTDSSQVWVLKRTMKINTHSVSLCCDLYTVMYSGWTDPGVN